MAATVQEVLMGLGSFGFDVDWDIETWNELASTTTLVVFEGERLAYAGAITDPIPGRGLISLKGRSLEYWLGLDASGPTVEDRWYVSGANCLANPTFDAGLVHWTLPSIGIWYLDTANPGHVATRAAGFNDLSGNTLIEYNVDDQPFVSDQLLEVAPGYGFLSGATIVRDVTENEGRLRFRHTYAGATFVHPDLASPYSAWTRPGRGDIHFETDPQGIVKGDLLRIQTALPNLLPNGSFDDSGGSLNGWVQLVGNWYLGSDGGHNGAHYMFTNSSTTEQVKYVASHHLGGVTPPPVGLPVKPGEEYRAWAVIRTNPGFSDTDGEAYVSVGVNDPSGTTYSETAPLNANDSHEWKLALTDFTIPDDGTTDIVYRLQVTDQLHGQWDFDDCTIIRTAGNSDYVTGPPIPGVSGRTYRWRVPYRSDPGITDGLVQLNMACSSGGGQPDMVVPGPALAPTENALQTAEWDFTMPAGYDHYFPQVSVQDLHGGAYFVGQGRIVDTDTKTVVFETYSPLHAATPIGGFVASNPPQVPDGTKLTCQFSIVAEPAALGWRVSNTYSRRTASYGYAAGEDVVDDVCTHPQTGLITLNRGQIHPAGLLEADWHVLNLTNRAILAHLSTGGLVLPYREWRSNYNATLHWGLPEEIFEDHTDIVLGPDDFFLLGDIQLGGSNNEDAVSDVKLVGASYTTLDGTTVQIIGRATNPPGTALDYWGNPVRRMLVNSNTAIDIPAVADRYADYLASRAQMAIRAAGKAGGGTVGVRRLSGPPRVLKSGQPLAVGASPAITVELADPRVLGPVVAGDWIYLWDGVRLEDSDYELPLPDGRLVHPVQKRILSMTRKFAGGAFRVYLRRPDGTMFPDDPRGLPVKWEDKTTTTLELGDLLTEFAVAPEGGDAATQFLRFLTATPSR